MYHLKNHQGVSLLTMENHYLDENYKVLPHTHSSLEISCVKSGNGSYLIDGKTYDMQAFDVFVINNIEPHCIKMPKGGNMVNTVIHFEPEFIWSSMQSDIDYGFLQVFFERNNKFSNRLDRNNPATKTIYNLLLQIEQEFVSQPEAFDLMIKIKLQSIFVEIIRNFDYISESCKENEIHKKDTESMLHVFEYISNHYNEDIKLGDLAAVAMMSPSYFSTSFKAYNGLSPFDYLARYRIKQSIAYMRSTGKSLTEIALLCGFNNSTSFIKSFKKVTGKTPSNYRQEKGQLEFEQ
jgi:AraC-like DNA-binding protein